MKCRCYFFARIFLLFLLAGVAACSQQVEMSFFVSTDATDLLSMHWQPSSGQDASGQWSRIAYAMPFTVDEQPEKSGVSIHVTSSNGTLTIASSGVAIYTGSKQNNRLITQEQGQAITLEWYAMDMADYSQLARVFEVSMQAHIAVFQLSQTLQLLPVDSDPATANFQVQRVTSDISQLRGFWQSTVGSSSSQASGCKALSKFLVFWPYHGSFAIPNASKSTLAVQIAQVQQDWMQVQRQAFPPIPQGMTLPWRVNVASVSVVMQPAQVALSHLQTANQASQIQLTNEKQQYDHLVSQVNVWQKKCHN